MSFQEIFPKPWKEMLDKKYKREKSLYEEKQEAMTNHLNVRDVNPGSAPTMNYRPISECGWGYDNIYYLFELWKSLENLIKSLLK